MPDALLPRPSLSPLPQVRQPYLVLVLALLAGDAKALDALVSTLSALQLPSVLATIEDYMWCKLVLLQASQVRESVGSRPASVAELQRPWMVEGMETAVDGGSARQKETGAHGGTRSCARLPFQHRPRCAPACV